MRLRPRRGGPLLHCTFSPRPENTRGAAAMESLTSTLSASPRGSDRPFRSTRRETRPEPVESPTCQESLARLRGARYDTFPTPAPNPSFVPGSSMSLRTTEFPDLLARLRGGDRAAADELLRR